MDPTDTRPPREDILRDPKTFFAWQRNHMANERTFLAWCRTALSFFIFSFVIERFDFLLREVFPKLDVSQTASRALANTKLMSGAAFLAGVLVIGIAAWRFVSLKRRIDAVEQGFSSLPDYLLLGAVLAMVGVMAVFFSVVIFF
jgi:putative membrane protein